MGWVLRVYDRSNSSRLVSRLPGRASRSRGDVELERRALIPCGGLEVQGAGLASDDAPLQSKRQCALTFQDGVAIAELDRASGLGARHPDEAQLRGREPDGDRGGAFRVTVDS